MKGIFKKAAALAVGALCFVQGIGVSETNVIDTMEVNAASVRTDSSGRKMEYLNRGVSAISTGKSVFVSWRSLEGDPVDAGFNVYRTTDGNTVKLDETPLTGCTNYTDTTADLTKNNTYSVKMVVGGIETDTDGSGSLTAN